MKTDEERIEEASMVLAEMSIVPVYTWSEMPELLKEQFRKRVRAVLEAAYPERFRLK